MNYFEKCIQTYRQQLDKLEGMSELEKKSFISAFETGFNVGMVANENDIIQGFALSLLGKEVGNR